MLLYKAAALLVSKIADSTRSTSDHAMPAAKAITRPMR